MFERKCAFKKEEAKDVNIDTRPSWFGFFEALMISSRRFLVECAS